MKKLHKMRKINRKRYCEEDNENNILDAILGKLFDKKSSTATPSATPNSGNSMGGGNSFGNASASTNSKDDDDVEMGLILQHMLGKENNPNNASSTNSANGAKGIMDEIANFLKANK